ncbi:SDR family NAD(P)-dependent oxidoreductase [Streptomyces sp. XD-27]|uniref:SDR family NAD(P)-dependent oxidoreductase n=1 Tax=Streptomyces sp. XD-27 TaxID=3062779 RepID=UPI0026F42BD2|nr:SDR family NAD(P)-dependent oxidoreductase [Streptomyces sp. XD-27]WKX68961.1 SDR family NAD(P)-dependent oxidoreductase [Streptomyces sp. XD-27]
MPVHDPVVQGEFTGRVALVTGAGHGIGAAVARALARLGATVAAADRDADTLGELSGTWRDACAARQGEPGAAARAGALAPYRLDVTDRAAVDATVAAVERDHGPLDILVNVAGVLRTAPAAELSDQDWADTFAVNTTGVFHTSRAVASRMAMRRSGCIVTVDAGTAGIPHAGMAAYAASKAAAGMFTKCLGRELARSGVRCNVVAPGAADTPTDRAAGGPLPRAAAPRDIADAVVFLASDRARHITMQDLYVDGATALR